MKNIILFLIILTNNITFAQSNINNENYKINFLPKPPEQNSLDKFTEIPKGSYSGVFSYSIPLYTINSNDISLPISLDYMTTGIKVNELSNSVGLGWNINIGNISFSQKVNNLDDFRNKNHYIKNIEDFNPEFEDPNTPENNKDYRLARLFTGINDNRFGVVRDESNPDQFSYSLLNNKGSFILDHKNIPLTFPKDNVSIKAISPGGVEIIDKKGIKYFFSSYKNQIIYPPLSGFSEISTYNYKIDSIISPNKQIIKFLYKTNKYNYLSSYNESKYILEKGYYFNGVDCGKRDEKFHYRSEISEELISKIIFENGVVDFIYDNTSRKDIKSGTILKKITVKKDSLYIKDFILNNEFLVANGGSVPTINNIYNEDFKQRLFLKSLKNNLENNSYDFSYYGENLNNKSIDFPQRFSPSADFWGNYNGSTTYLPNRNGINSSSYIGSDKSPNISYSKNGSLSMIKFPTGGYQEIQYELDDYKYDSEIEIKQQIQEGIFDPTRNITNSKSIDIDLSKYKINSDIYFYFYYENSPNSGLGPNDLPLENSGYFYASLSENGKEKVRIYKNGNIIFSQKYNPLDNSKKYTLTVYRVGKAKDTMIRAFLYFEASSKKYLANKFSGNLRIKTINLQEDSNKPLIKKEYEYKDFTNNIFSSGNYYGDNLEENRYVYAINNSNEKVDDIDTYCTYLKISNNDLYNLYGSNNKSVLYKNVTEKVINVEDKTNYITQYTYTTPKNLGHSFKSEFEPFVNQPDNSYLGGLLLKELKYKNNGGKIDSISSITNKYEFDYYFNQFSSNYDYKRPYAISPKLDITLKGKGQWVRKDDYVNEYTFSWKISYQTSSWIKLLETTKKDYFSKDNVIESKIFFDYSKTYNHLNPIKQTTSNSKGETLTTEYQYPSDLTSGYPESTKMTRLVNENRIAEPVIVKQKIGDTYVSEIHNQYKEFNGILQKSAVFQKKGNGIITAQNTDRKIVYNSYDVKGNITQYTPENGLPVAIIWGYNSQYPVAKLEGITYDNAKNKLGTYLSKLENGLLTNDEQKELRSLIPEAMITTYVYKPLVGVTQITGPNGMSEFYKYDYANRLEEIKNDKEEVLKTFQYNYKN